MTTKKNWQQRQQEVFKRKMTIKNNYLTESCGVNKFGTQRQQLATKMLPVLPAKTSPLATNQRLETRVITGLAGNVANVAAVATCKATSQKTVFILHPRGQFAMTNKPHFLTDPEDSSSWQFRMDCMAWELYTKKTAAEREAFIKGQPRLRQPDFRNALNRVQAWWMLTYLARHQIESDLAAMPVEVREAMRGHLNAMRLEIKKHRQIKHKTYMGDLANA